MNPDADSRTVLIVGAGVGGLTTAIALRQAGVRAKVFERADAIGRIQVGGGLHLWPNATRALRAIGLADRVAAIGTHVETIQFWTARGKFLTEYAAGDIARHLEALSVGVSRGDLQRELVDALGDEGLHLNAEARSYRKEGSGVTLTLSDGSEHSGDLLIGADGADSVIRRQMLGSLEREYSGYTCYIGTMAFEHDRAPSDVLAVTFGQGPRFIYYHLGRGKLTWIADIPTKPGAPDPAAGRKALVQQVFGDWREPVAEMVAATDEDAILRRDLFDRAPVGRWSDGPVTLLGDAAHVILPHFAQGACQAIEDGFVLTKRLTSHGDVPAALASYEEARRARTADARAKSRRIGKMGSFKNPLLCGVRNRFLVSLSGHMKREDEEFMSDPL